MADVLPFSSVRGARPRHLVGVHLDEGGRRLSIAGVAVHGQGLQSRIEIQSFSQRPSASLTARLPAATAVSQQSLAWEAWTELRSALAEEIAEAVVQQTSEAAHSQRQPSPMTAHCG